MPLGQQPCEVSHRFTGRHFQPNFDGTDNQVFEKILVKQYPAQGHCFLSLSLSLSLSANNQFHEFSKGLNGLKNPRFSDFLTVVARLRCGGALTTQRGCYGARIERA
jgi:hypothetical protein